MAECDDGLHDQEAWEERTLNLLHGSEIDQELSSSRRRKGARKRKMKWMQRQMTLPEAILEFLDQDLRENAIRYLSNYLVERREEDPETYYRAGFMLFNSCSTMCVLLQEVLSFYPKMEYQTVDLRSIKRLVNVLTLFQSVAANNETRKNFVDSCVSNYLIPLIRFECAVGKCDTIRAVALSVIGILCQGREPHIIKWAIESDVVIVCHAILETGSELTRVIAMHILEAILQDPVGISYVCVPTTSEDLLTRLMEAWDKLVKLLVDDQEFSPRLLFHIVRCYIILCSHDRGYNIVKDNLPTALTDDTFQGLKKEYPIIRNLIYQLLLNVGMIRVDRTSSRQAPALPERWEKTDDKMPLRSIDLNALNSQPFSRKRVVANVASED